MDDLNHSLQLLIEQTCSHPPNTPQRRKALNQLLRVLLNSGQIQTTGDELYREALYKAMFNLTKTLCDRYNPSQSSFLTWFKVCIRNQYRDELRAEQRHQNRQSTAQLSEEGEIDPLDRLAAPIDANLLLTTWEAFVQWIQDDPDQTLRRCHLENNPNANAQALAYSKLILGKEWQQIAAEVGSPRGALSSFWSRKCQPLLQTWLTENRQLFGEESHD